MHHLFNLLVPMMHRPENAAACHNDQQIYENYPCYKCHKESPLIPLHGLLWFAEHATKGVPDAQKQKSLAS